MRTIRSNYNQSVSFVQLGLYKLYKRHYYSHPEFGAVDNNYFAIPDFKQIWIAGRARFNAPDLKSDVGSNLPGVRIPRYPPYLKNPHLLRVFYCLKFIGAIN
jgi:hypothetical protein